MKDPLGTYLHDHLAGATFAVEMLEALKEGHPSEEIGAAAGPLLREVEEDRELLKNLVERVSGNSSSLKEVVSWIAEKAARLKLRRTSASALGTFETVEALALGILGKEHLWRTLEIVSLQEPRLHGPNYASLAARARAQHAMADALRIRLVNKALLTDHE